MRKWTVRAAVSLLIAPFFLFVQAHNSLAAAGDSDTAITFNGSNNYLTKLDPTYAYRSSFTIQGWIRPTEVTCSNTCTIFSHDADYVLKITAGTFRIWQYYNYNNSTSELDTGVYARANEWQHIAYTFNSGSQKIYLNGQLVWSNVIAGWTSNPTYWTNYAFKLGYHYGSSYFYGQMDEIRLFSSARTVSEINSDMHNWGPGNSAGLIAYYDMNDLSGSTVTNKATGASSATTLTMNGTLTVYSIESISTSGGYTTVTIPRSYLVSAGGYKIPIGVTSIQALVVGGGGGGGADGGGGGGGGGVFQSTSVSVNQNTFYEVEVGVGGRGGIGYQGGTGFCNGSWSSTVVACSGGTGGSSNFAGYSASGGGGGGGIEADGLADSDAGATARGGGGGAGGQNALASASSPGVGAFSGGATVNTSNNAGGGGASGVGSGFPGSTSVAGNGATGTTATINSVIYGSGGAGGNFMNSTLATGGSGAGDGGTSTATPTTPAVNRGGGGSGGGNGSVAVRAKGTAGASGVVIIKYALRGGALLDYSGNPVYGSVTTLTATTNTSSKVTFLANNKRIPGCISVLTTANVATCNWKPAFHGSIALSLQVSPLDTEYASSRITFSSVLAQKRTSKR